MISTTSTSPVYLHDQGHTVRTIGVAVSLHLGGMYVASPLSGWLCDRFGRLPMIGVGALVLIGAVMLAGLAPGSDRALVILGAVPQRRRLELRVRGGQRAPDRRALARRARVDPGPRRPGHGPDGRVRLRRRRHDSGRVGIRHPQHASAPRWCWARSPPRCCAGRRARCCRPLAARAVEKRPIYFVAPSAARSTYSEYASRAAFGRRPQLDLNSPLALQREARRRGRRGARRSRRRSCRAARENLVGVAAERARRRG